MSIDNCKDCPPTCLGHVLSSKCVEYNGESLETYLANLNIQSPSVEEDITSDDVISASSIKRKLNLCSSEITERVMTYSTNSNNGKAYISWNTVNVISRLPSDYYILGTTVKLHDGDGNEIGSSTSKSSSITVDVSAYPLKLSIEMRIGSDCGEVILSQTVNIISATQMSNIPITLDAVDLLPEETAISVTKHLDLLEIRIHNIEKMLSGVLSQLNEVNQTLAS